MFYWNIVDKTTTSKTRCAETVHCNSDERIKLVIFWGSDFGKTSLLQVMVRLRNCSYKFTHKWRRQKSQAKDVYIFCFQLDPKFLGQNLPLFSLSWLTYHFRATTGQMCIPLPRDQPGRRAGGKYSSSTNRRGLPPSRRCKEKSKNWKRDKKCPDDLKMCWGDLESFRTILTVSG